MQKGTKILLFVAALVLLSWGVYECKYYGSYWLDTYQRPWAYSSDPSTKLLVGTWQGAFKDPDGVEKKLTLEIVEPISQEERAQKAGRLSRRRRTRENKQGFDGKALAVSRLGAERYEVYGAVNKDDYHQLHFNFRPEDEKKRVLPNFTLLEAQKGSWQDDALTLTLTFAYHRADGSSHWSSADPRHSQKVSISMTRVSAQGH